MGRPPVEYPDVSGVAGAGPVTGLDMDRGASSAPGSGGAQAEEARRLLLIGPPPHREGGGRLKFEIMFEYFSNLPNLVVHQIDLPVHHPLYREDGRFGPLRHSLTLIDLSRAMVRMARADTVILVGSPDFCFSYGSLLVLCAKLFRVPSAAVVAGGRGMFSPGRLPAPARAACLALFRAVDRIVVQTEVARNDLPARLRSKTRVLGNFRPLPPGPPRNRCRGEETRFAFVGRHGAEQSSISGKPEKGLDVLLEAFERVHAAPGLAERIELHVYGPIPTNMIGRVQRTPAVFSHGLIPNGELRAALQQHDVLAFPSRYAFEGRPGAIVEAFMAGLPVIASDLPGPMEIVEHEVNGLIVPTDDPDAFAEAMNRLAADHGLRRRLAAGAWASASHFDQEKILPELAAALGLPPGPDRSFTTEG